MKTIRILTIAPLLAGVVVLAFFSLRSVTLVHVVHAIPLQTTPPVTPPPTGLPDRVGLDPAPAVAEGVTRQTAPSMTYPVGSAAPLQPPATDAALKALPSSEQQSLWRAFAEARHAIQPLTATEQALPQNQGAEYCARNPGQRLIARFLTDGGVRLGSGLRDQDWQATLKLDTGSTALAVTATGNRIETRHANGLTEWFENQPEGIEHGFTVAAPQGDAGVLELRLSLNGLRAEADPEAAGDLRFVDEQGTPVLGYRGLKVWDAAGFACAGAMHPTADGSAVLLTVLEEDASYPLTIDPLLVSWQKLLPPTTENGNLENHFGIAVALDGDTALIGAGGIVYVFVRSGLQWQLGKYSVPPGMRAQGARMVRKFFWRG